MSVPKSERRQSDFEYIVLLQELEKFFIRKNLDEKNRIPGLNDELMRIAMDAYNKGTLYFEVKSGKVMGGLAQQKKYCKETYWTVRELASQINILMAFRLDLGKTTKELQQKTQDILKVCNLLQAEIRSLNKATNTEKD